MYCTSLLRRARYRRLLFLILLGEFPSEILSEKSTFLLSAIPCMSVPSRTERFQGDEKFLFSKGLVSVVAIYAPSTIRSLRRVPSSKTSVQLLWVLFWIWHRQFDVYATILLGAHRAKCQRRLNRLLQAAEAHLLTA